MNKKHFDWYIEMLFQVLEMFLFGINTIQIYSLKIQEQVEASLDEFVKTGSVGPTADPLIKWYIGKGCSLAAKTQTLN